MTRYCDTCGIDYTNRQDYRDIHEALGHKTRPLPRTPEQGHTKKCLARALICAVQNLRDDDEISDTGFVLRQGDLILTALDYYDGLLDCICPEWTPFPPIQHTN